MTLDEWIRLQDTRLAHAGGRGSPATRDGRMSDTEFGRLLADGRRGIPAASQQAVGLWRRRSRVPREPYGSRIVEVTKGAVTLTDLGVET